MSKDDKRNAFILRIAPSGDRVEESLKTNEIIIGWSKAEGLTDEKLSWKEFRQIIYETYYQKDENYIRAGRAAGNIWRFIRDMKIGDYVIVPHGSMFYIAEVVNSAYHDKDKIEEDTAYRRHIKWLNNGRPIPRSYARKSLQLRMKVQHTCAYADDLVEDIEDVLALSEKGVTPTFDEDLRRRLINETLKEIQSGRINDRGFEILIKSILISLGANDKDVKIISRGLDKGADIIANFNIANTFQFTLAVQAKHYQPDPPVNSDTIEQLLIGMEAESADLGWVVTSGTFSDEAIKYTNKVRDEQGIKIELIDGEQLALLIIESGLKGGLVSSSE